MEREARIATEPRRYEFPSGIKFSPKAVLIDGESTRWQKNLSKSRSGETQWNRHRLS
jgi:hypothetical protein